MYEVPLDVCHSASIIFRQLCYSVSHQRQLAERFRSIDEEDRCASVHPVKFCEQFVTSKHRK